MTVATLHADEVEIDAALVGRLVASRFPVWRDLPLRRIASSGTDNAMFRLGRHLCLRLPRYPAAAALLGKEQHWLPRLAPHLPLAIPVPLATAPPGEGYPLAWSVCRWIPGEDAHRGPISDRNGAALTLARFIQALQAIDPSEGPRSGSAGVERGVPLLERDERVRQAIVALAGDIDVVAVTRAWDAALAASPWRGPPVWLHGDLHPGNLLLRNGALVAVIDFGGLGVGDPACDLLPAWTLFSAAERRSFRAQLACDEAGWARGKGWALSIALIAWPYYRDTNPAIVDMARRTIERVLADADWRR